MDLTPTQLSTLRSTFKLHANPGAKLGSVVAAFFGNQLFFGYIVKTGSDTKAFHKDIQWLVPTGDVPYENSTVFTEDVNEDDAYVCNFVKYSDLYVIHAEKIDDEYVTMSPKRLVASLVNKRTLPQASAIKKPRLDTSSYPSERKREDEYKKALNNHLAALGRDCRELCTTLDASQPTAALYLDADDGATTQALCKRGFHTEDLFCPNESQKTINVMQKHLRAAGIRGRPHSACMTIESFTSTRHDRKFSYVWIDGVSTWVGSKSHCTRDAVLNLFRNNLLAPFAVVAYTASIRPKTGDRKWRAVKECRDVFVEIRRCARQNGYLVSLVPELRHNYGIKNADNMFTSFFRVYT